jgi:hypothetical protein
MQYAMLGKDEKEAFRAKINEVLGLHGCPWRLSDGEFFKLDNDFIGARLARISHSGKAVPAVGRSRLVRVAGRVVLAR